jgi:hypothetical protein
MYTMTQTRTWSTPHLKEGCWYIEYGKTICPVEEEDVKTSCDKADPRGVKLVSDNVVVPEEVSEVDIALLPEKEGNKILNQRTKDDKKATNKALREAMRTTAKAVREATAAAEKEARKGEKLRKSKIITPPLLLTETSTTSPS